MSAPARRLPTPPPEADLIRIAREAKGISPETAAKQTPIRLGGSRWRHIERGYERRNKPVERAPAKTIAHMAHTVGLTPDRLAETGREDAAEILAEILRMEAAPQQAEPEDEHWVRFRRHMDAATKGMTPRQRAIYAQRYADRIHEEVEEEMRQQRGGRRRTG